MSTPEQVNWQQILIDNNIQEILNIVDNKNEYEFQKIYYGVLKEKLKSIEIEVIKAECNSKITEFKLEASVDKGKILKIGVELGKKLSNLRRQFKQVFEENLEYKKKEQETFAKEAKEQLIYMDKVYNDAKKFYESNPLVQQLRKEEIELQKQKVQTMIVQQKVKQQIAKNKLMEEITKKREQHEIIKLAQIYKMQQLEKEVKFWEGKLKDKNNVEKNKRNETTLRFSIPELPGQSDSFLTDMTLKQFNLSTLENFSLTDTITSNKRSLEELKTSDALILSSQISNPSKKIKKKSSQSSQSYSSFGLILNRTPRKSVPKMLSFDIPTISRNQSQEVIELEIEKRTEVKQISETLITNVEENLATTEFQVPNEPIENITTFSFNQSSSTVNIAVSSTNGQKDICNFFDNSAVTDRSAASTEVLENHEIDDTDNVLSLTGDNIAEISDYSGKTQREEDDDNYMENMSVSPLSNQKDQCEEGADSYMNNILLSPTDNMQSSLPQYSSPLSFGSDAGERPVETNSLSIIPNFTTTTNQNGFGIFSMNFNKPKEKKSFNFFNFLG